MLGLLRINYLVFAIVLAPLMYVWADLPKAALKSKQAAVQKARDGQTEEALKILENLSQRHPKDLGLVHDRVVILSEAGQAREALALFEKLDAGNTPPYVVRAAVDSCREVKDTERALKLVAEQIAKNPSGVDWRLRHAQLLMDKGEGTVAAKELDGLSAETRKQPDWLKLRIQAAQLAKDWAAVINYNQQRISAQPEPNLEVLKAQLDALLHLGKDEQALTLLETMKRRFPDDADVLRDRMVLLSRTGRDREAMAMIEKIDSEQAPDYVIRAAVDACRELEKTDLALKLVGGRLMKDPQSVEWRIRRAQLLVDKGDGAGATKALEEIEGNGREHSDWLNVRILAARSAEDWDAVLRYNQQRMDAQGEPTFEAMKIQADALLNLKKYQQALEIHETLSQLYPDDAGLLRDRVVILNQMGKNSEALLLLKKIDVEKAPDYVIRAAVDICRELKETELAMKLVNGRLAKDRESVVWRIRRAQLLTDQGDGKTASEELDEIKGDGREHPDWLNARVLAARSTEDWQAVIRFNQQRMELKTEPSAEILKTQVDAFLHLEKYPEALSIIEVLSQRFPDDAGLAQDRAVILARTGKSREALDLLKKIDAEKAPDYVIRTAVDTCRELGETVFALKLVDARLAKTPKNVEWRIRHAQLLVDKGKAVQAAKELEKFREVRDKFPDWLDVRIYAARMAEDWTAVLRYSMEKADREEDPDVSVLGSQVDALIHLGAAHAAERILKQHPEVATASRESNLTERISGVELRWSSHGSVTMKERVLRADAVIERLDEYSGKHGSSRKKDYLRVIALHDANRWQEAVDDYEALREKSEVAPFVMAAAAGSYLALKQPEMARDLYQETLDAGFVEEEASSGLFYALVESEDFVAAYDLIDRLAREEPPYRHYSGTPGPVENGRRLDLEMMRVDARYYADQLDKAWLDSDRMREAAPGNNWIREMHSKLALSRGWRHQALEEYKVAAAINPDSAAALTGVASSLLQIRDYKKAETRLKDLEAAYPQSSNVKHLRKDWDVYQMAELWSDFSYTHSNGPELNGGGLLATAELYGSPLAYRWRPVVQGRYAWSEVIEGESRLAYIGVGAEYRSPNWELLAAGGYVESRLREDGVGNIRATWRPGDHWRLTGEYSTFNLEAPMRALWYGIAADRSGASLTYRWHESRRLSVNLVRSDFTDGNERWEAGASFRQRLIDVPHLDVDGLLNAYASQNSREDAPYFNPEEDLSYSVGLDAEHIIWRRYDRTWVQHVTGELGYYDQKNYDKDWTGRVGYDQRLTLYPDWELVVGVQGGRRIYDGNPEPFYGFNILIHARF